MTELEKWLAEQERLCNAASKGPWKVSDRSVVSQEYCIATIEDDGGYEAPSRERRANGAMLAASRTSLPQALRIIKAILAANEDADLPAMAADRIAERIINGKESG
jgi:hypothetical protein